MKKIRLITAALLFIILSVIALYLMKPSLFVKETDGKSFFPFSSPNQINRIEILFPNYDPIILSRGAGGFVVEESSPYPADPDKISKLLTVLQELTIERVASVNPDNWVEFEVDGGERTLHVLVNDFEFWIGKNAKGYATSYTRRKDDDRTYIVSENVRSIIDPNDWRDLGIRMFSNQETVASISYQMSDQTITVSNQGGIWIISEPEQKLLQEQEAMQLVDSLKTIRAQDVSNDTDLSVFEKKELTITVTDFDGSERILDFADYTDDENKSRAKVREKETIYVISSTAASSFINTIEGVYTKDMTNLSQ